MPLSKGTTGLYKTHHCKCNIVTYLLFIYLSIYGVSILFTLDFLIEQIIFVPYDSLTTWLLWQNKLSDSRRCPYRSNFRIQGKRHRHIADRVLENGLGLYVMSHVSMNIIQQMHGEAYAIYQVVEVYSIYRSIKWFIYQAVNNK